MPTSFFFFRFNFALLMLFFLAALSRLRHRGLNQRPAWPAAGAYSGPFTVP
jgi:hypothetical protein